MESPSTSVCELYTLCRAPRHTDFVRVTEFGPKDQHSAPASAVGLGRKGGKPKHRTKREDLGNLGSTANAIVSNMTRTEINSPIEGPLSAPQQQWPRLVRSATYNPDYPTFCECL